MTLAAASVVFHCLPLLQDYKNFQNGKFDFNVTSVNSSTNLDDRYPFNQEDFYNATSKKYGYNVTENVRSACDEYTDYCGTLVFTQLPEETAFATQSDIELAKENLVKITKKYLIEEEANPRLESIENKTAYDYALENGNSEIVEYLEQFIN